MNILITEHYDNESAIAWICNFEKASEDLKKAIEEALDSDDNVYEHCDVCTCVGFQNDADQCSIIEPPCQVDCAVEIYV
jgi:hypothetical protein